MRKMRENVSMSWYKNSTAKKYYYLENVSISSKLPNELLFEVLADDVVRFFATKFVGSHLF